MGFRDESKVHLEVAVNGTASKAENPNVPYGAEETARDVVEGIGHGATSVQFHARDEDGRQAWSDVERCRTILATAARDVDALAYPGYAESLEHIWELAAHPPAGAQLLVAPFDPVQHVKGALWSEEENQFRDAAFGATEVLPPYPPALDRFAELGLVPSVSVFNAVDLRWVVLAARIGILRQPLMIKLFFSDCWVSHNEPDPAVLDFLISRIPTWIDHEIVVVPFAMSSAERCQEVWEYALDRGLGIRVGIGDCPAAFPKATNAEMVDRGVKLITKYGLTSATQQDFRSRFAPVETGDGDLVRVVVNRNRCLGWGVCYTHAPEIYQPDAEGYCIVVKPQVSEALLQKAIDGAASCPERAIRVELCDD
jgi:3-keto-5-aminohexanoate cleavage enzyme